MAENIGLRGYRVQDPARTEARRREIMLAMAEVILEKGYAAATLEDVATRIGTSRAVIYYQFRSKDDIYVDICVEAVANAATRLEAIVAREDPADATLYAVLRDLIEVGKEPLNHSTLVTGRPRSLPDEGRERIRALDRRYTRGLIAILKSGIDSATFIERDPRFLAYTLIYSINGNFVWRRPDGPVSTEYVLEELPRMLVNSVLAHPCDYHAHDGAPPKLSLDPQA
jgi:AcrR family transcriptional regulator